MDLVEKAVSDHKSMTRKDIDELLWNKLPEWMEDKQRKIEINNLISELRIKERIYNKGNFAKPIWVIKERK